jgi:hypothetical protein
MAGKHACYFCWELAYPLLLCKRIDSAIELLCALRPGKLGPWLGVRSDLLCWEYVSHVACSQRLVLLPLTLLWAWPKRLPRPATESLVPPIGRRAIVGFRTSLGDHGMDTLHGLQQALYGLAMKGKKSNRVAALLAAPLFPLSLLQFTAF